MKILIADDDRVSRRAVERMLAANGFDVVEAADGHAAWEILDSPDGPSLALLDWMMPGPDGMEICRRLRAGSVGRYVYTVLLTSRDRPEDTIAGLSVGADDYLVKPIGAAELTARLRAGQRVIELESQLLGARAELEYKATHDPLTRTLNREEILNALDAEVERSSRTGEWATVIMADLDHFKLVNDRHGHPAGDTVLAEVARRLSSRLRQYDLIGRYGGEEFLIVLPSCGADEAHRVADRLRQAIEEAPITTDAGPIRVTMSVGVTSDHGANLDATAMIGAADRALYRAKDGGRNRVESTPFVDIEAA